jgi:hypothetical protein
MFRRFALAAVLIAALAGLSACGNEKPATEAETEGIYVTAGGLKYQVQISRALNPDDKEDSEYLHQVPAAEAQLGPDESWFGVFMRVQNPSDNKRLQTASEFNIEDTTGAKFSPIEVTDDLNSHFYNPSVLEPGDIDPALDTTAGSSTTQGSLLLFKIPNERMANRPLVLHIVAPTGGEEASVDLDV